MIIDPAPQGTKEWEKARLGLPTASQFHRIVTPKTLKPSGQATDYRNELLAEWKVGRPLVELSSGLMQRGNVMEQEARRWYEFVTDNTVEEVGLCLTDDGRFGASPDGLIGDDRLLEIKCPGPKKHVSYMVGSAKPQMDYRCQIQGQLLVTGRQGVDFVSYHPDMEPVLVRCEREDDVIERLTVALEEFWKEMGRGRAAMEGATP